MVRAGERRVTGLVRLYRRRKVEKQWNGNLLARLTKGVRSAVCCPLPSSQPPHCRERADLMCPRKYWQKAEVNKGGAGSEV